MDIEDVTVADVTPVIKKLVEEFGEDYVYPRAGAVCVYQLDGEPSCIVGHVLDRLGVPYEEWWDDDQADAERLPFKDELVSSALAHAQRQQDIGYSWGEALEAYQRRLEFAHES